MLPNLVNFGQETAENGWPVFAHTLNFRFGRLPLPALPHGHYNNRQRANFGTCYVMARAYGLEQQNVDGLTMGFAMHL